jgi:hypothetical protein
MAELAVISAVAGAAASGISAIGTIASGNDAADAARAEGEATRRQMEFEAQQHEIAGKDALATSQREMLALRRQKKLALSSLTARGAAGGFSATDPTALGLADEIERYGTEQELFALYGGRKDKADEERTANAKRFTGYTAQAAGDRRANAIKQASYYSAAGTILGGISDIASKYGKRSSSAPSYRYG